MKSTMFFLFLISHSFFSHSQEFEPAGVETQMEYQEEIDEGEVLTFDGADTPAEMERQEDILYPEGEETDWSLRGEELAAEEYE